LYTSANLNGIDRLRALYNELETNDFKQDLRHEKFNDWVDYEMGDDVDECDEDV
jgi:hypothetical protein